MIYRYKNSLYVLGYLILSVGAFILSLGVYAASVPDAMKKNYWFATLICFAIGGCLIIFAVGGLLKHRPISVEESGVSTYLLGRLVKHIRWSDMCWIERRRYIDPQRPIARYKYSIYGNNEQIWFDDQLQNLRSALDTLNGFARQDNIEIVEIDAGIDTKRRLLDMVADPIERKKLQREGVRNNIQNL